MKLFLKVFLFQPSLNFFFIITLLCFGNIGLAVLIFSVLIRLLLWPGYEKAIINQRKLAKIQPQIQEIQKRLKDDPKKANQEVFQLFRQERIQLASVFFLLLQTFVFLFFFFFFNSLIAINWEPYLYSFLSPFFSGMDKLNYIFSGINLKTPSLILVLISIALNIGTVLLQPSGNKNKIPYIFLPFIILLFYQKIPAIVILFWIGTNIVGLIQDYQLLRLSKSK